MVTAAASGARRIALPTYDVTVAAGILERLGDVVREAAPAHRYAVVTDSNVGVAYGPRVLEALGAEHAAVFTVPAGESHKTRESWARVTDALFAARFGRDTTIVALGGGVIGDLAGFVAATFMRGIPFVQVPTTLLAMIDASVGGKTGVDTPAGKNLVGAFHQPAAVVADLRALATLPSAQLAAGMAEAIKHGVIADAGYLDSVAAVAERIDEIDVGGAQMLDLVARSIEIKADVVRRDERESGLRKILNFGHTIGHAIEHMSGYSILHGEAVAVGMVRREPHRRTTWRRRVGHGVASGIGRARVRTSCLTPVAHVGERRHRGDARRQEGTRRQSRVRASDSHRHDGRGKRRLGGCGSRCDRSRSARLSTARRLLLS